MHDADILITGVTGFVGRFILHAILERADAPTSIAVIIRASGKRSAQQRWTEEIMGDSLFAQSQEALRGVRVIDAALEQIETTTHHLHKVRTLIHCAANIKHYDPYEALERDNVGNVKRVLKLAESLHVQHLLLLSTCYVHPRKAMTRPAERVQGGRQEDFYNDYCYTKWLGEEAVYEANARIPNISLVRLSCVGAPLRWDLAVHPCAAQAHLGILSLALRGFVETLAWRPNARISTVPVDVVAEGVVRRMEEVLVASATSATSVASAEEKEQGQGIRLLQFCAPPAATTFHISLPLLVSMLQTEFGLEDFRGLARADSTGLHLSWWKQVAYSCLSRGQRAITLHTHVQDFVSTFTDEDIRFESSLDTGLFPTDVTERDIALATCEYAVRILHSRQLARGVPISRLDQFWHRLANREPVQACMRLKEPVPLSEWPALQKRLWAFFLSHRKCAAGLSNVSPLDGPIVWRQLSGHSIPTYFGAPQKVVSAAGTAGDDSVAAVLEQGLHMGATERIWHITPFYSGAEQTHISHILLRFDHALTDGAGVIPHLPEFSRRVFGEERGREGGGGVRKARTLNLALDIWMGLVYVALLAVILWTGGRGKEEERSREPTVATDTWTFQKPPNGRTYTTDILWRINQFLTKTHRESHHVIAVPAVVSEFRPAKDMPTNAFVPVLLPVESGMSEEAFAHRCMLLRSRTVRFISWCLVQLLEWGVWDEIRDALLGRVRCVVSSLQMGAGLPAAMESLHVVTTTPTPVPYSLTVISGGEDKVFVTARSHNAAVPAARILSALATATATI